MHIAYYKRLVCVEYIPHGQSPQGRDVSSKWGDRPRAYALPRQVRLDRLGAAQ
jgi:hypothetical protein